MNAQNLARNGSEALASMVTGLKEPMLKRIAVMSLEEIDKLSSVLPITVFTMRLDESSMEQVFNAPTALAGALSVTHLALSGR
ncbi:hypothetical protein LJR129_005016 [Acidovorax sp. LjRoot129]